MNPLVAAMIASLTCGTPPMTFRDFFHQFYLPGSKLYQSMETQEQAVVRLMNAAADFQDYRVVWAEQCGSRR